MRWDETLGLMAGSGKAYTLSKLTIEPSTSTISEYRMCGGVLPVYNTTAAGGNVMVFQRTPQATFDLPTMPTLSGGSAARSDAELALDPGSMLVGVALNDATKMWPASATDPNVTPVDADGDGKPGITSLMRNDDKFTGSPTSILQTDRVDANYIGSQIGYRATIKDPGCADMMEGVAELVAYNTMIIGCHVKDRDDCTPDEVQFIEDNRPKFVFSTTGVAHAAVIPVDATCAQALQVLDLPSP